MSVKLLTESLQNEYDKLCQSIKPADKPYRFLTEQRNDGSPHVEINENDYHYVVTERGVENSRRTTKEPNEILYWMISDITFWMAVDFELKHRIEGRDFRRLMFAKQLELLQKAHLNWAEKRRKKIEAILTENPFVDKL